ncbi:F-box protein PP2-B10-like [Miscanthus floridulus]|uniref:F-box protein PP2-B10-like n=1 Tax=Miscanthus floridulus TaxID=154761 RepID=UPI003458B0D1
MAKARRAGVLDDNVADTLGDSIAAMLVLQWCGKDDTEAVKVTDAGEQVLQNGGEGTVGGIVALDGERMWLDKASGAKCYMLSARALSLPWHDGEFSWTWTAPPALQCTSLDIYGRLPVAELTPATCYAAYLVYGLADGHRGLSFPDQETTVALASGRVGAGASPHAVCLHPDEAEARKFRAVSRGTGAEEKAAEAAGGRVVEMEMGQLRTPGDGGEQETAVAGEEEVVVSFEVLGWYPKRGLIVKGVEFRPVY